MATRPKYVELEFTKGPGHSLLGYDIVSSHTEDGVTHLFLKLREKAQAPAPARPKRKRRTKAEMEAAKAQLGQVASSQ